MQDYYEGLGLIYFHQKVNGGTPINLGGLLPEQGEIVNYCYGQKLINCIETCYI